jgi:hypothetical protein
MGRSQQFAIQLRRSVFRFLISLIDILRKPIRNNQILIVQGDAGKSKLNEVKSRTDYICSFLTPKPSIQVKKQASIRDCIRYSVIAYADSKSIPRAFGQRIPWIVSLDFDTNPFDGWSVFTVGNAFTKSDQRSRVNTSEDKFNSHIKTLKQRGNLPVYVFGTGPTLQNAFNRSFEDGFRVVCNTIVKDQNLWDHLKPDIFCAGDAIYHFGKNIHAVTFRAATLSRLKESYGSTIFVYPATFDLLVRSEFQEVESSLVPIPVGNHVAFDMDLRERFLLPVIGNVLNQLLIPLAMTLSKDIRLWGFDGRAPNDAGFWKNSNNHSYPDLVDSIRTAHPAFFAELVPAGQEARYVESVHGDSLHKRLLDAESKGYTFTMLHRSWTKSLHSRFKP